MSRQKNTSHARRLHPKVSSLRTNKRVCEGLERAGATVLNETRENRAGGRRKAVIRREIRVMERCIVQRITQEAKTEEKKTLRCEASTETFD